MADTAAIGGIAASLQAASVIVKGLIGIHDTALIQDKVIELQGVILAAQSDALTAQSDQFSLLDRVRQLETQMAELKAWDAEKQKYELTEITTGTFAYALKDAEQTSEPAHWICPNCFQHHQKSILQRGVIRHRRRIYHCHNCKSEIDVEGGGPNAFRRSVQVQRRPR